MISCARQPTGIPIDKPWVLAEMPKKLSRAAIESYRQQGFFFPCRVMSSADAEALRNQFETFDLSPQAASFPDRNHDLYLFKPHVLFAWADAIVNHPGVLDVAEDIVGPNILCWSAGLFRKPPRSTDYVSWHQDATHYHLDDPSRVVRIWVALTPANTENGTMVFAPGTHKLGQMPHRDTVQADGQLSRGETVELDVDPATTVPVVLGAGEASIHHLHVVHASGGNRSAQPRINLVITYIATSVRQLAGADTAMLVRGQDYHGHYALEPRPKADFDRAAVEAHRRAMAIRNRNFFGNVDRHAAMKEIMAKADVAERVET